MVSQGDGLPRVKAQGTTVRVKGNEHLVIHHESQNHLKKTIDWVQIGVLRSMVTPQISYYSQGYSKAVSLLNDGTTKNCSRPTV